jgi:hypothetical protein
MLQGLAHLVENYLGEEMFHFSTTPRKPLIR